MHSQKLTGDDLFRSVYMRETDYPTDFDHDAFAAWIQRNKTDLPKRPPVRSVDQSKLFDEGDASADDASTPEVTLDLVMRSVNAWAEDAERSLDALQDILTETTRLAPLFQAAVVKRLGELKHFHNMTKSALEKEIKRLGAIDNASLDEFEFWTDAGFNARAMRDALLADFPPIWTLHGEVRLYDEATGIYKPDDTGSIEKSVREKLGDFQSTHCVRESVAAVQSFTLKPEPVKNDALIPFKNGVLDFGASLKTDGDWVFHEHSPDNLLLSAFPVDWDTQGGTSDRFSNWVAEIVAEDDWRIIFEMMGAVFHKDSQSMQSGFLLIGDGSNGKSLLLDILVDIVGIENTCTSEWGDFGQRTFANAELFNKALAMDSDIQVDKPIQASVKKAQTADWISGEEKYKKPFAFKPFATWIGAANALPTSADQSYGFFRRWIPIRFPNTFAKNRAFAGQLKADCLSEAGKAGIVALALTMYREAYQKGAFSVSEESVLQNQKLQQVSSNVEAWVDDCCRLARDHYIERNAAFADYQRWLEEAGSSLGQSVSKRKFYEVLRKLGCVIDEQDREFIDGKRVSVIRHLDFVV